MTNIFTIYARLGAALVETHNYLLGRDKKAYLRSNAYKANLAILSQTFEPVIDMVLFCPACRVQHIDAPDVFEPVTKCLHYTSVVGCAICDAINDQYETWKLSAWTNPPHRSHLCAACGFQWRPADVCTNGVAHTATRGENDTNPERAQKFPTDEGENSEWEKSTEQEFVDSDYHDFFPEDYIHFSDGNGRYFKHKIPKFPKEIPE